MKYIYHIWLFITVVLLTLFVSQVGSAQSQNITLIANVNDYPQIGYSDVWGYTAPNGDEYAMLGTIDGVSIVNVTDPNNIAEADYIPYVSKPPFGWYDMKTYQNYMYVSTEGTKDILIVDLSPLPDSALVTGKFQAAQNGIHNIFIDTVMAVLYVVDAGNVNQPVLIYSLSDPVNPAPLSSIQPSNGGTDSHDVFVQDSVLYVAEGTSPSIGIFDVRDPANLSLLSRIPIPDGGYSHQVWVTEDNRYMVTTEETVAKTVKIWDIQDIHNPSLISEYLGSSQLAHNAYFKGDYLYISHYESGLKVVDVSDPSNPFEVGFYDTYQQGESPNFHGAWGVYPFTQNGMIFVSDIETGLYAVRMEKPTDVDSPGGGVPIHFSLEQNFPNPFNPITKINYQIPERSFVTLKVFDFLGSEIATLVNEEKPGGSYEVDFNARELSSGIYFYKLQAADYFETKKMVLMK